MSDPQPTLSDATPASRLVERALSRASGTPLSEGNAVDLLIDARVNFDAWLAAIGTAKSRILLENYIVADDAVGRQFLAALCERALAGVRVHIVADWLGCLGNSRAAFWKPLLDAGGQVRLYNPPRLDSPLGWLSRDHRKLLVVDGTCGFISGICVASKWLGDPARGIDPWRDTGVCLRGPACADIVAAFAANWAELGAPLEPLTAEADRVGGDVALRVIATQPRSAGIFRTDQLIAAMARKTLWLTDAYFVGLAPYVQALCAAAGDGVDVRLLVPGTSNLKLVARLSHAGYRPLLEAGVRVFEWNGSMLHAKTAVADGLWARVGSSNMNVSSWFANCEIDVAVEDEAFARCMTTQYEADLGNATEIVLARKRPATKTSARPRPRRGAGGSSSRAAASTLRLFNTVSAALGNRRVLRRAEAGVLLGAALMFAMLATLAIFWPRLVAWPLAMIFLWLGIGLTAAYRRMRSVEPTSTKEI
jgi:cardiolipin synthase A/B